MEYVTVERKKIIPAAPIKQQRILTFIKNNYKTQKQ